MALRTDMKRYDPQFPTVDEASKNPSLVYSDHLPIQYSIPVGPNGEVNLKIVSWNVYNHELPSGYEGSNYQGSNPEIFQARHHRLAQAISNQQNSSDVIVLQEVSNELLHELQQLNVNRQWDIKVKRGQSGNLVTLYNKEKLVEFNEGAPKDNPEDLYFQTLNFKVGGHPVSISNAHLGHDDYPLATENTIRSLIEKDKTHQHVVLGDFNSRVAPKDFQKRNIATGVVPSRFREPTNIQGVDWTDGAFCISPRKNIVQVDGIKLDIQTGQPAIHAPTAQDLNPNQQMEMSRFRMHLCLDELYQHQGVFNSEKDSLFRYESELRASTSDRSIMIREASNMLNEKAIGIRFSEYSKNLYSYVSDELKSKNIPLESLSKTNDADGKNYHTVFVPVRYAAELQRAIDNNVMRFTDQIPTLKVAIVGEKNSGKTALLRRHTDGVFSELHTPDLRISIATSNDARLQVLDDNNSKHFMSVHAFIVTVDLTDENALSKAKMQIGQLARARNPDSQLILVGTKSDQDTKITYKMLDDFAKENNLGKPIMTSSKNDRGIEEVFNEASKRVLATRIQNTPEKKKAEKSLFAKVGTLFSSSSKSSTSPEKPAEKEQRPRPK